VGHPRHSRFLYQDFCLSIIYAEPPHYRFDVIVLKEADCRDTGGSGFETGFGVGYGYSSEREHWDCGFASLSKCEQSGGVSVFFFEDGSEYSESRAGFSRLAYVCRGVARDCYQRKV
jgi:hypothetical protein